MILVSLLYVALMISIMFYILYLVYLKILHIPILLKEKPVLSLVPHPIGHMDFLFIKQVSAYPLYVYFSDSDRVPDRPWHSNRILS